MIGRLAASVAIVAAAVASAPAAQEPVLNSADLICAAAPLALVAVLARRRSQTPVEAPRLPQGTPSRGLDGLNQEGQDR